MKDRRWMHFFDSEEDFDEDLEDLDESDNFYDDSDNGEGELEETDLNDHDGHRRRLRRRINRDGFDDVRQKELLELILCYVQSRQDVNSLCDELLEYYGDLRELMKSNREEFSRFEGLGEDGVTWLDSICTLARLGNILKQDRGKRISNFRMLRAFALRLAKLYPGQGCVQVLSDERDHLLYHNRVGSDLRWGESAVLARAGDEVFSFQARNCYIILYTDDPLSHPTQYDLESMNKYTHLLNNSRCVFRDVLFMNEKDCVSLNQKHMMNMEVLRRIEYTLPSTAEDELPMPPGGLIVHPVQREDFF